MQLEQVKNKPNLKNETYLSTNIDRLLNIKPINIDTDS